MEKLIDTNNLFYSSYPITPTHILKINIKQNKNINTLIELIIDTFIYYYIVTLISF